MLHFHRLPLSIQPSAPLSISLFSLIIPLCDCDSYPFAIVLLCNVLASLLVEEVASFKGSDDGRSNDDGEDSEVLHELRDEVD